MSDDMKQVRIVDAPQNLATNVVLNKVRRACFRLDRARFFQSQGAQFNVWNVMHEKYSHAVGEEAYKLLHNISGIQQYVAKRDCIDIPR